MAKRAKKKKNEPEEEKEETSSLAPETKRGILVVVFILVALLSILSLAGAAGVLGQWIAGVLTALFGWTRYGLPIILLVLGYILLYPERYTIRATHIIGLFLLVLAAQGIIHLGAAADAPFAAVAYGNGGGYVGLFATYPLLRFTGFVASLVILIAVLLIGLLLTFETSLERLAGHANGSLGPIKWLKLMLLTRSYRTGGGGDADEEDDAIAFDNRALTEDPRKRKYDADREATEKKERTKKESGKVEAGDSTIEANVKPKSALRTIDIPLDLLSGSISKPTSGDIVENVRIIEETLANFSIPVEMGDVSVGPTVTQYTLRPAEGVRIAKINALGNDLALALAAHPIRIEAPIPGKSLVGIEVPNQKVAMVRLRELLSADEFRKREHNMHIALGKDVSGKPWIADLTRMPHLLVAGATGSGKSVCLNTIILSLLYQNGPDTVKFIFVDPKRVELTNYNGIPHLLTPVVTDIKKTVNALKWLLTEMDRRFELLSQKKKRDIGTYNKTTDHQMPYIVLVIDELADLMVAAANEVEAAIIRLAQMSRAVGIHLVLATQRPSVDVITGLIKANVPARIAFSVASAMDSRTIIDMSGAEKLVGRGDMLFSSADLSKPKRLQGVYVSDKDIGSVVSYVAAQADAEYDESILEKQTVSMGGSGGGGVPDEYDDPLIPDAKEVIKDAGKASASLLQRRLRIGYARAARLLDILEQMGYIGPSDGAKPREILMEGFERDTMNNSEDGEDSEDSEDSGEDAGSTPPPLVGGGGGEVDEDDEDDEDDENSDWEEKEEVMDASSAEGVRR